MVDRVVIKQLGGAEDLLLSLGTVTQARGSGNRTITGINAAHMLIEDLASIFTATQVNTALQEAMAAIIVNAAAIAAQQATIATLGAEDFNGSFEEADSVDNTLPADWVVVTDPGGTVVLDTTDVNNGNTSLKFTSTGTGGGVADSKYLLTSPGDSVGFSWSMKSDVVDVQNDVTLLWYDKDKVYLSATALYTNNSTNPTAWARKEGSGIAPATAVFVIIRLTGCNSADITVGNTRFDGVTRFFGATQAQVDAGTVIDLFVTPETLEGKPGLQVQQVNVQDGLVATGTTVLPLDDTIPQNTEGDEYITLAITPKSTTNKLLIEVVAHAASSVGNNICVALFQDSIVDALASCFQTTGSADKAATFSFAFLMTAGTIAATTFKVRIGGFSAGTTTFNGQTATQRYGGVLASSIRITEIKV